MPQLTKLFEPGRINSMVVRNGTYMSPMGTQYADNEGFVTDRLINFYVARSRVGPG